MGTGKIDVRTHQGLVDQERNWHNAMLESWIYESHLNFRNMIKEMRKKNNIAGSLLLSLIGNIVIAFGMAGIIWLFSTEALFAKVFISFGFGFLGCIAAVRLYYLLTRDLSD